MDLSPDQVADLVAALLEHPADADSIAAALRDDPASLFADDPQPAPEDDPPPAVMEGDE